MIDSRRTHGALSVLLHPTQAPLVVGDMLIALCACLVFAWLAPYYSFGQFNKENIVFAIAFSACFGISGLGLGYYERETRFEWRSFLTLGCIAWALAALISLSLIHFLFFFQLGRVHLLLSLSGALLSLIGLRSALATLLRNFSYRYAIFGPSSRITDEIKNSKQWSRIGQHYYNVSEVDEWLKDPSNQSTEELLALLKAHNVAEIVLTRDAPKEERLTQLSMHALRAGYRVVDEISFYTEVFERYPVEALSETWILFSEIHSPRHLSSAFKRLFDLVTAFIALVLLSPLLLAISLIIKLTSKGPVLFIQARQGRFCEPFKIYKFRTMQVAQENAWNPPSTRVRDPRITTIGRLIRPLHFDELPQLLNILKGDMSWVGPRPEDLRFAGEIPKTVPIYDYRHLLRPGLTGPAQLQVGYTLDNVEGTYKKLAYDLYYLKYRSLLGDLVLMLRTAFYLTRKAR